MASESAWSIVETVPGMRNFHPNPAGSFYSGDGMLCRKEDVKLLHGAVDAPMTAPYTRRCATLDGGGGKSMTSLTLELAERVIDGALHRASELGCVPLTVVVLDAGGHDIALKRQDGAGILRADIARAKAWGALGMGYASREIGERAQKAPGFFGALAAVSQGRLVPAAGGVLILDNDRKVIGAVGISGDTSDRDEDCALSGIRAAGLQS